MEYWDDELGPMLVTSAVDLTHLFHRWEAVPSNPSN